MVLYKKLCYNRKIIKPYNILKFLKEAEFLVFTELFTIFIQFSSIRNFVHLLSFSGLQIYVQGQLNLRKTPKYFFRCL